MSDTKRFIKATLVRSPELPSMLAASDKILAALASEWNKGKSKPILERYAALLAAAESLIDESHSLSSKKTSCRAGCDSCCRSQHINVSGMEAMLLARHIELHLPDSDRARVIESILSSEPTSDRGGVPCALLGPSGCSAYASRPITCRAYLSVNEDMCRNYIASGKLPDVLFRPQVIAVASHEVSKDLARSGRFEINAILRRIYSDPDKPSKWAAGSPTDESDLAIDP